VLLDGRVVMSGGPELAERVEHDGFDAFRAASKEHAA
jgi:Fe-S cluster assembly ATPase SufC